MTTRNNTPLIRPRYTYSDIFKKPVDVQVSMLAQNIADLYAQIQGTDVRGLSLTDNTSDDSFAFMVFDP